MKLIRSFFGAALCAFAGLWPALHFDIPWLLAPFGIVGWMIGYHGDRLYLGLRYGVWEFGERVRRNFVTARDCVHSLWLKTTAIASAFGHGILVTLSWANRTARATPSTVVGLTRMTWQDFRSRRAHPVTVAYYIRLLVYGGVFTTIVYLIWQQRGSFGLEIGDLRSVGISNPVEHEVVTATDAFIDDVLTTFTLSLPALIAAILGIGRAMPTSNREFFVAYERYDKLGLVRYTAIELFDYVRALSFVGVVLFSFICFLVGFGVSLLAFGLPLFIISCIASMVLPILYGASQVMWLIAKADEDYGLGSLGIGLSVATATYLIQPGLETNQQLIAALVSGLIAGLISMGITLVNRLFEDIRLPTPSLTELLDKSIFDKLSDKAIDRVEKLLKSLWGVETKLLPPKRLAKA